MLNKNVADLLNEIASFLSLEDFPNVRFEVRAYQKAVMTIGTLQEPIEDVYKKGGLPALMELPGVGKSIAALIEEYIKTGKTKKYDGLRKKYPIDMAGLTSIQGMGAKKALTLYKKLGVKDIDGLKKALAQHKIAKLEGFGEKSEEMMLRGLQMAESGAGRLWIGDALPTAEEIVAKLKASGLVDNAMIAGSTRRMRETVGDLDILVISKKAGRVMEFFTKMDSVDTVIANGPTKSSVRLKMGLNCDLRVLEADSFGAAVQYFTGSKDHNIQVRTIAVNKGYKLNEYGLFDKKGKNVGGAEEESIYEKLGMQWMPPEMREARGEVKLAQARRIPRLVELKDLKGDMHTHTKETDGANSLEEMAEAAMKRGLEYMVSTNHTQSLYVAKGMDEKGFAAFGKRIDKLNDSMDGKFTVFKGAEVEIKKDGSLDLNDSCLKAMDFPIGAVHSSFTMGKEEMTKRIVKAMDSGLIKALAHPTGRVIGEREAYAVDLEKVAEAAERNNIALEINSFTRMDLNDTNIMLTSKYKINYVIDSDAHRTAHFAFLRYGVGTARRGWLGKERVLNTMDARRIRKMLKVD